MKFPTSALLIAVLLLVGACQDLQDGLSASMSDAQILRVLKLDPANLHSERVQGKDGQMMIYTDRRHEICITRSVVSGVIVTRMKPNPKHWELGKP